MPTERVSSDSRARRRTRAAGQGQGVARRRRRRRAGAREAREAREWVGEVAHRGRLARVARRKGLVRFVGMVVGEALVAAGERGGAIWRFGDLASVECRVSDKKRR